MSPNIYIAINTYTDLLSETNISHEEMSQDEKDLMYSISEYHDLFTLNYPQIREKYPSLCTVHKESYVDDELNPLLYVKTRKHSLIVIVVDGDKSLIIDGNHRINTCHHNQLEDIEFEVMEVYAPIYSEWLNYPLF